MYILIRRHYTLKRITEKDLPDNPIILAKKWVKEAIENNLLDPNAAVLSTSNKMGRVSSRTILVKKITDEGFYFFTNYNSRKAMDIEENNYVSLLFFWPLLERQIQVRGTAEKIPYDESAEYFSTRDRMSQIGAWASKQSQYLPSRLHLLARAAYFWFKYLFQEIPCPPHWGGYIIKPYEIEFWQGGNYRLHSRFLYKKENEKWIIMPLYP